MEKTNARESLAPRLLIISYGEDLRRYILFSSRIKKGMRVKRWMRERRAQYGKCGEYGELQEEAF